MHPTAFAPPRPARLAVLLALALVPLLSADAAAQYVSQCGTASGNFKDTRFGDLAFTAPITAADFNLGHTATTVLHHVELQGGRGNSPKAWLLCVQYSGTMQLGPYASGGAKSADDLLVRTEGGAWVPVPTEGEGYLIVHRQEDGATVDLSVAIRLRLRWKGPTDEPGTYGGMVEWLVSEY